MFVLELKTYPAILKGTVNDPTTFPPPSRSHGSHHWAFERLLSASLVPLTAAAFATSGSNYAIVDALLGVGLIMHSHIGVCFLFSPRPRLSANTSFVCLEIKFDCIVVDYLPTRKFPVMGQIAKWGLRSATVATLVGIYQFNTNDIGMLYRFQAFSSHIFITTVIGLTELIAKAWTA